MQNASNGKFHFNCPSELGTIHDKIQVQHYSNDRYDAGLWCDALETLWVEDLHSDNYFLVNDSLMAMRETDEFLSAIKGDSVDFVSLNYWNEQGEDGNWTWLESPARAFSARGMEIFRKNICEKKSLYLGCNWHVAAKPRKRCLVEKTELSVTSFYDADKYKGLYPGEAYSKYRQSKFSIVHPSWTTNIEFWKNELVDKMNFPAAKVSRGNLDEIHCRHPEIDFSRLLTCSKKYPNIPQRLLEACKR